MLVEHKGTDNRDTTIEQLNIEKKSIEKDVHLLRQELATTQSSFDEAVRNKEDIEKQTFLLKKQVYLTSIFNPSYRVFAIRVSLSVAS